MSDLVSAREAARMIHRNERTVRRWIVQDAELEPAKQRLPGAARVEPSGEFRVPVAALRPYLPAQMERADGSTVDTATGEVTVPAVPGKLVGSEHPDFELGELRGVLQAIARIAELDSLDDRHFRDVVRGVLAGRAL